MNSGKLPEAYFLKAPQEVYGQRQLCLVQEYICMFFTILIFHELFKGMHFLKILYP